jgi:hypothetical protein
MSIAIQQYIRKPLYVDAVRITAGNFAEMANWCQGQILWKETNQPLVNETDKITPNEQFIKVRVHNPKNPRQTQAFVGDWLLYTPRGYKIYTNKAFHALFDRVPDPKLENGSLSDPRLTGDPVTDSQQEGNGMPKSDREIGDALGLSEDEVRETLESSP